MKINKLMTVAVLLVPLWASSQVTTAHAPGPRKDVFYFRHEMGRWWQDSDIAQKLQLTDNQIGQLNQIFTQHRLHLDSYLQDEQKANQSLENLLATEQPDEDQLNGQIDQVLAARGKLQREFTTMNVDFRKVLTLEQWKQLKSIHQEHMKVMIKKLPGPGGKDMPVPPGPATMPMLLPPPDGLF